LGQIKYRLEGDLNIREGPRSGTKLGDLMKLLNDSGDGLINASSTT